MTVNEFAQPVGTSLPEWTGARAPSRVTLTGMTCRLEPFSVEAHAVRLWKAYAQAPDGRDWTYMSVGPFAELESYLSWARIAEISQDPLHFTVVDNSTGTPLGTLALMRQAPEHGVIEVGSVTFSTLLKNRRESTEAQYLLMRHVFDDLGFRRYEWKCDSLNGPSRRAAERLGFSYEGTFRQALVVKGRNRDTAWFSLLDSEWPAARDAFARWLDRSNFDEAGAQIHSLAEVRAQGETPEA